jgi:hypothetical protein
MRLAAMSDMSSASMDPDTSTTIWMAIASAVRRLLENTVCGRASAATVRARPATTRAGSAKESRARHVVTSGSRPVGANRIPDRTRLR